MNKKIYASTCNQGCFEILRKNADRVVMAGAQSERVRSYKLRINVFRILINIDSYANSHLLLNSVKHAFFLGFNGLEIWNTGVFGVTDYESERKIYKLKMADAISSTKM